LKHLLYLPIFYISLLFTQVEIDTLWTFTNCGQEGCFGPAIGQCEAEYSGTSLEGQIAMPGFQGYQEWTVPRSGIYTIEALGAGGANGFVAGGMGVRMKGDFVLEEGETIKILVGQMGSTDYSHGTSNAYGGGGGGTFLSTINNSPLVVAAGGHGANGGYSGPGGSSEIGNGEGCQSGNNKGGCSGGFYSNGGCGNYGYGFLNGGNGGYNTASGGFGGASGTSWNGSGAGGGYEGGSGTDSPSSAPTGIPAKSYNAGTNQNNAYDVNENHGLVVITLFPVPLIDHTPLSNSPDIQGPYSITAEIVDYAYELESTSLFYSINSGDFTEVSMLDIGDDTFTAEIPGQDMDTRIDYYISASNSGGYTSTTETYTFYTTLVDELTVLDAYSRPDGTIYLYWETPSYLDGVSPTSLSIYRSQSAGVTQDDLIAEGIDLSDLTFFDAEGCFLIG